VIATQARDQLAFAELVRRRQGWMRALMRRLCGNAARADDLAQEAFMKAWDKVATLEEPAAFPGWLRRVAVTTFLMEQRRAKLAFDTLDDANTPADEAPSPAQAAQARLDLERALALLSAAERLCVTLNHAEGMSHAEISEATGLPLGTVKSHVLRGTEKLRRVMCAQAA
jgi:RNA polymerase sigma-70 factor (ECF subfamily)